MTKRCAIVIGASSGVGEALVRLLVDAGWNVVGMARRAKPDGPRYRHVVADVRAPDFASKLRAAADELGQIEACIYCTGIGELLALPELSHDRDVISTNLLGAVHAAEVVIPRMIAQRSGHFVGLSSLADRLLSAEAPSYNASKAGLSSYLEGLALACRPYGVALTNVRFGFVDTAMAKAPHKPFMISADHAARVIIRSLQDRPLRVTYPRRMALLLWLLGSWQRLRIHLQQPGRGTSLSSVLTRYLVLLAAWALVWVITPAAVRGAAWSSFTWWTTMKGLVWMGLGAALFGHTGRRAWFDVYRGRIALVLLLGVTWATLDAAAVHLGLRPAVPPPSFHALLSGWNATLNVFLIAPLFEELLFRGLFWSAIEATGQRQLHAWTLSAGAFAALHLPGWIAMQGLSPELLPQFGLTLLAGLLCGAGRWLTGSVWPAVLLHLVNNLASAGVFHG